MNGQKMTPLHFAAWDGQNEVIQVLLKYHALVDSEDENGLTPLHAASWQGLTDTVLLLIKKGGADVSKKSKDGWTPLHYAAMEGQLETVRALVENNADIEAVDKDKNTALHLATWHDNNEVNKYHNRIIGWRACKRDCSILGHFNKKPKKKCHTHMTPNKKHEFFSLEFELKSAHRLLFLMM